jgi:alkylhydroperoxidase family enzyme
MSPYLFGVSNERLEQRRAADDRPTPHPGDRRLEQRCPAGYRFAVARLPYTDPGKNLGVNIFRVMNNAPAAAKGFSSCGSRLLGETKLDAKLRELVIDAISVKLDCPYEWSHHGKWALDVGATPEELEALKSGDFAKLGPRERTVVEYAMKVEDNNVTDTDVEGLRTAGLDDQEIAEVTLVAGFYGMTARFLNAMDVDYDEGNPQDFAIPDQAGASAARRSVERLGERKGGT